MFAINDTFVRHLRRANLMTEMKRRPCLIDAGEPLLLPLGVRAENHVSGDMSLQAARRQMMWLEAVGAPQHDTDEAGAPDGFAGFLTSQLVPVPLPIYTDAPGRQFARISPQMLWHPVFWLPQRLAGRYQLVDPEGVDLGPEDDDAWAVRVALELMASGLYDTASGTWLDVLARVGIDVDDPVDVARIEAWQQGAYDPVLDTIDLSPDIDLPSDLNWAAMTADALLPDLVPASWALAADDLATMASDMSEPDALEVTEPGVAHQVASTIVTFGRALLCDVEWPIDLAETHEFWEAKASELEEIDSADYQRVLDDVVAPVAERLFGLRERYWPHLGALSRLVGAEDTQAA